MWYRWRDRVGRSHLSIAYDIVHFRDLVAGDFLFGFPRAAAALIAISADDEAMQYVRQLVINHGSPGIIVRVPETTTDEELKNAARRWRQRWTARGGRGGTAFMRNVEEVIQVGFNLENLEFPELRSVSRQDICTAFNVDPILVGSGKARGRGGDSSLSGQQYREARMRLIGHTVMPLMKALEAELDDWFAPEFTPPVQLRFSQSVLAEMTEDEGATSTRIVAEFAGGIRTREEARQVVDLPTDVEAKDHLVIPPTLQTGQDAEEAAQLNMEAKRNPPPSPFDVGAVALAGENNNLPPGEKPKALPPGTKQPEQKAQPKEEQKPQAQEKKPAGRAFMGRYSEDQPREPAGSPEGGEFAGTGGAPPTLREKALAHADAIIKRGPTSGNGEIKSNAGAMKAWKDKLEAAGYKASYEHSYSNIFWIEYEHPDYKGRASVMDAEQPSPLSGDLPPRETYDPLVANRTKFRTRRGDLKPEHRVALWRGFDARARREESAYKAAALEQFAKERAAITAVFAKDNRSRHHGRQADDPYIQAALKRVLSDYEPGREYHQDWMARYTDLIGKTFTTAAKELPAQAGLSFTLESPYVQHALQDRAAKLAEFITQATAKQVTAAVSEGIHQGLGVRQIADLISETVFGPDMTDVRATRIAQTESIGALNQGEYVAAHEAGIFTHKEWLTQGDELVRDAHEEHAAEGVVPMEYEYAPGLWHPGDQTGEAEEVINCRCSLLYYTADTAAERRTLITPEQRAAGRSPGRSEAPPWSLFLVRHGATADDEAGLATGWADTGLSELGRQQADQAAEFLAQYGPGQLYTSDLPRATETAEILSALLGVDATPREDLRPWNLGVLSGKPESVSEAFRRERPYDAPVNGESWSSRLNIWSRAVRLYAEMAKQGPVIVVTHSTNLFALDWAIRGWGEMNLIPAHGSPGPGGVIGMNVGTAWWQVIFDPSPASADKLDVVPRAITAIAAKRHRNGGGAMTLEVVERDKAGRPQKYKLVKPVTP
jgi:broad specificity phosphatase PhoE